MSTALIADEKRRAFDALAARVERLTSPRNALPMQSPAAGWPHANWGEGGPRNTPPFIGGRGQEEEGTYPPFIGGRGQEEEGTPEQLLPKAVPAKKILSFREHVRATLHPAAAPFASRIHEHPPENFLKNSCPRLRLRQPHRTAKEQSISSVAGFQP
jgi:hypothetical protein